MRTLQAQMSMIPGSSILKSPELVGLGITWLYSVSCSTAKEPYHTVRSYLDRTLCDPWYPILPVRLILTYAMPVDGCAVFVIGEIIVHGDS